MTNCFPVDMPDSSNISGQSIMLCEKNINICKNNTKYILRNADLYKLLLNLYLPGFVNGFIEDGRQNHKGDYRVMISEY